MKRGRRSLTRPCSGSARTATGVGVLLSTLALTAGPVQGQVEPPATASPAATAPVPAPAAPSPPESPATPATRADVYAEFRRRFDAKDYEEAVALARRIVDLTAAQPSPGDEELQVAWMNLATAQYQAGDYAGAEDSYQRVVSLIEATGRMTNPRLGRAVAGLAQTYHAAGRHDLAVGPFDRAIGLSRRTEGLFNEQQLPLLEQYADSLVEVDRLREAVTARRYGVRIVQREYGARSLQSAGALESIGRWYARVGAYDSARNALRQSIEIIEAKEGPGSARLIGPLTAIADCARRQLQDPSQELLEEVDQERRAMFHDPMAPIPDAYSPTAVAADAERALELAVTIAKGRPDISPVQLADVHTQLGDWYQRQERPAEALRQYRLAWKAATGVQLVEGPLTEALFGRPLLIHYEAPEFWNRYARRPANEIELRSVEIDLTVTAEGLVRDPKVVTDAGDPKLAAQAIRAAHSARYRPRLENGEPVETPATRFSQPFIVLLPPPTDAEKPAG